MPGAIKNFIGREGFIWFIGVVEDRQDPEKMNRVRVRCNGIHTDDKQLIPTEDLPWAHTMFPPTNPGAYSPKEGDWVCGFFLDGDSAQNPVIMGVLPGKPFSKPDYGKGFSDPRKEFPIEALPSPKKEPYPLARRLNEPTTTRLAREMPADTIVDTKKKKRRKGVKCIGTQWEEPAPAYAAKYPYNYAHETESGHAFELDDTPKKERVHLAHKKGSYIEIDSEGKEVHKVVNDKYTITMGDDYVHVEGSAFITVLGNCNLKVTKTINVEADSINIVAENDIKIKGKNIKLEGTSGVDVKAGSSAKISAPSVGIKGAVAIGGSGVDIVSPLKVSSATNLRAIGTDSKGDFHNLLVKGSGASSPADASATGLSMTESTAPYTEEADPVAAQTSGSALGKTLQGSTESLSQSYTQANDLLDQGTTALSQNLPTSTLSSVLGPITSGLNELAGSITNLPLPQMTQITDKAGQYVMQAAAQGIAIELQENLLPANMGGTIGNISGVNQIGAAVVINEVKQVLGKQLYPSTQSIDTE